MRSIWAVRRSAQDHKVSGLAAGIARLWNVDPVLIRVGFVVLAFAGGVGIVLYAAGWLMVPLADRQRSRLDALLPQTRNWSTEVRIGIVAVACLLCLAASSWVVPVGLAAAAVLAAIWYFGSYKHRPSQAEQDTQPGDEPVTEAPADEPAFFDYSGQTTPFTEAARGWQDRIIAEQQARADAEDAASAVPAPETAPDAAPGEQAYSAAANPGSATDDQPGPEHAAFLAAADPVGLYAPETSPAQDALPIPDQVRIRRRRSARRLGLVTVLGLGLALTGLGVASAAGLAVPVSGYLAAALLIIGCGLLAGTKYGRPPGAALAAILVAVAMVASLIVTQPTVAGQSLGVRNISYDTAARMPSKDRVNLGQLNVNLSDLKLSKDRTYRARVDNGQLRLVLPRNARTKVRAIVHNGRLRTPGNSQSGSDLTDHIRAKASTDRSDSHPDTLTLVLRVDRGELEVQK